MLNKGIKILLFIVCVVVLMLTAAWYLFCPIFNDLPRPSGVYSVGNVLYHWKGGDTLGLSGKRNEFNVDIFYPSANDNNNKPLYAYQPALMYAFEVVKAKDSYVPQFVWHCLLSNTHTYTKPNVPLATTESVYPVLLYLPGIGGEDLHNVLLEELASHGYIICAIEPPYDTAVTAFPGGEIIPIDSTLKKAMDESNRDTIYAYRNQAHERWNKYIEFTIAKLQALNHDESSMFYQKLDLGHLGLMGVSHGGAVVTDFCANNKLCKAGINMDGWTKTYNSTRAFSTPFLFLTGQGGGMPEMQELFNNNKRPDFKHVAISGAEHGGFSDLILMKWPWVIFFGIVTQNADEVGKRKAQEIISFFDTYLRNKKITAGTIILLNGTSSAGKTAIIRALKKLYGNTYAALIGDDFVETYAAEHPMPESMSRNTYQHQILSALLTNAKQLSEEGKNILIDLVDFDNHYEYYCSILDCKKTVKVLVYCPLDVLVDRVEKRNKAGNEKEKRPLNLSFGQFKDIYKLQEYADDMVVDRIETGRVRYALHRAEQEVRELMEAAGEDPEKLIHLFVKPFVEQFKLNTLKKIVLVSKHPWDLIVNTDVNSPAEIAQIIAKYLKKR